MQVFLILSGFFLLFMCLCHFLFFFSFRLNVSFMFFLLLYLRDRGDNVSLFKKFWIWVHFEQHFLSSFKEKSINGECILKTDHMFPTPNLYFSFDLIWFLKRFLLNTLFNNFDYLETINVLKFRHCIFYINNYSKL